VAKFIIKDTTRHERGSSAVLLRHGINPALPARKYGARGGGGEDVNTAFERAERFANARAPEKMQPPLPLTSAPNGIAQVALPRPISQPRADSATRSGVSGT